MVLACALHAQPVKPRPEFEVENVTPNKSGAPEHVSDISRGGEIFFRNITIGELLPLAFQRRESLIFGSPAWFGTDRFDIAAKAQLGFSEATLGLMVQSLLAREFGLAFHEEQRPMDAFALVVANGGPRIARVPGPGTPGCGRDGAMDKLEVDCTAITMRNLTNFLPNVAPDYLDRPVVDQTGLYGTYELKLSWTPQRSIATAGGLTIFDAIAKQLGLKLEQRKLPVPVIVIDHAARPAAN